MQTIWSHYRSVCRLAEALLAFQFICRLTELMIDTISFGLLKQITEIIWNISEPPLNSVYMRIRIRPQIFTRWTRWTKSTRITVLRNAAQCRSQLEGQSLTTAHTLLHVYCSPPHTDHAAWMLPAFSKLPRRWNKICPEENCFTST